MNDFFSLNLILSKLPSFCIEMSICQNLLGGPDYDRHILSRGSAGMFLPLTQFNLFSHVFHWFLQSFNLINWMLAHSSQFYNLVSQNVLR